MNTNLTIKEMKKLSPHFFSKGAMEFFSSKIEVKPSNNFFITSEQFDDEPRKYTIRLFSPVSNTVLTIGNHMKYSSLNEARKALKDEISKTT